MSDRSFEAVCEVGRRLKVDRVRKYGDGPEADLIAVVLALRSGEPVAQVHAGPGPDGARHAVYAAACFMRPDEVFLIADSVMTEVELDQVPEQGSPRAPAVRWAAGERDGLSECMVLYRIPFIGNATFRMYPYVRHGTKVDWSPDRHADQPDRVEGALVDYAREGFSKQAKVAALGKEAADLLDFHDDPAEMHWHLDCAAANIASSQTGGAVVVYGRCGHLDRTFVQGEEQL